MVRLPRGVRGSHPAEAHIHSHFIYRAPERLHRMLFVESEAIFWRYEIRYCACWHKVFSDVMRLPHRVTVFLSDQ